MRLSTRYMQYEQVIDDLVKRIATLYQVSYVPKMIVDNSRKRNKTMPYLIYDWTSDTARENYRMMQEQLNQLLESQARLQQEQEQLNQLLELQARLQQEKKK